MIDVWVVRSIGRVFEFSLSSEKPPPYEEGGYRVGFAFMYRDVTLCHEKTKLLFKGLRVGQVKHYRITAEVIK